MLPALQLSPRARPLGPVLGIEELAAEARAELLRVLPLGEAEDAEVGSVAVEGMAAVAQRQVLAEEADGDVVAAAAAVGGQRHLAGPVAVDPGLAELLLCGRSRGHSWGS